MKSLNQDRHYHIKVGRGFGYEPKFKTHGTRDFGSFLAQNAYICWWSLDHRCPFPTPSLICLEGSAHFKSHQLKYSTNYTVIPCYTGPNQFFPFEEEIGPIGPIGNIPSHFPPCSGSKQGSAMGLSGPQAWRRWTVWFPLAAGSVSWSSVIDRPARRPSPLTPSSIRRPPVRRQFITMGSFRQLHIQIS